ncbi:MAG: protein-glutamate O-methyltransferase CheR [Deltaproteobacteria bacterium]|nr:protein-glutamate O-methyltransferase CheR [Deltaproteobacteria bacterium]
MAITHREFDYIKGLIKQEAAIVIDTGKEYLVESRLMPLAQKHGLASVKDLVDNLSKRDNQQLVTQVVEAMTTNETSFFRDFYPFEALKKKVIPDLIANRSAAKELVIWCAATSSGQEPYSLAMLIKENFPQLATWRLRIICSDISEEMLERTRSGVYNQLEVNRGLPVSLLMKYFKQDGTRWIVKDDLRRMLEVRLVNLAAPWPHLPQVDLIMMRNVLIYFDQVTKVSILKHAYDQLKVNGVLLLGSTETTINMNLSYQVQQYEKLSYYSKL